MLNIDTLLESIKWKFASTNHDDDFHTDIVFLRVSTGSMKQCCGYSYKNAALHYENFTGKFYYPTSEAKEICSNLVEKIIADLKWGKDLNTEIYSRSRCLAQVWGKNIHPELFSNFTKNHLLKLYSDQLNAQKRLYEVAWIPEVVQDEDYGIYPYLCGYLDSKGVSCNDVDRILKILSSGHQVSVYKKELSVLVQLANTIRQNSDLKSLFHQPIRYLRLSLPPWVKKELFGLAKKFGFLGYHGYDSRKPYDFADYLLRLHELVTSDKAYNEALDSTKPYEFEQRERINYVQKLRIDPLHQSLFDRYGEFAIGKAYRRLCQLRNFYFLDHLIEEISLRLDIPEKWLRFMKPEEIINSLSSQDSIPVDLEDRSQAMIFMISNNEEKIWTGKQVNQLLHVLESKGKQFSSMPYLYGASACGGKALGKAIVIKRKSEMSRVDHKEPAVLVSVEADPDLSIIMRGMAAVVTDQGGVTCHAAIIAREFNIPCIVGTQYATQFISEGDLLEVNADRGIVKIVHQ